MKYLLPMCLLLVANFVQAAGDAHHPHHVALVGGYSWHGNEESVYVGADYVYSFPSGLTLGGFIEDVRGDFDLQAVGVMVGKQFQSGFKISAGPGVEYKIKKDKYLGLVRAMVGYDWKFGSFTVGPALSYDWIEDASNTTYLGLQFGYGF